MSSASDLALPERTATGAAALRRVAIVPAHNEEGSIAALVREIRAFDEGLEVVVVDDGSVDGTGRPLSYDAAGGTVSTSSSADRFTVTWTNVPQFGRGDRNSFQVSLYPSGRIEFTYAADMNQSIEQGVVGIARGNGENGFGAVDFSNKCIYWAYPGPSATSGRPNRLLIYNYEEKRWSRAENEVEVLVTGLSTFTSLDDMDALFASLDDATPSLDANAWSGGSNVLVGFDSTYKYGLFSGSAGTAILDGQEVELTPGLYTHVHGVKPLVIGSPTTTVALGTRNALSDSVSYTSETTPTSRTGFADFRSESRYARARVTLTGSFDSAIGSEFQATPGGAA